MSLSIHMHLLHPEQIGESHVRLAEHQQVRYNKQSSSYDDLVRRLDCRTAC
ncbi:hypothetical protein Slin15195_G097170 [Septoria linicola]|uniref:Uncharacterized protein n=1 Tax=Septoria linicola TaxID=215465 RepID=A0A9Q9B2K5_9PEZI|nr:hypothetical protein Slin15195_G097170 [Septoria linicola]